MTSSFSQIVEDGHLLDYELVPMNNNFLKRSASTPKFSVIHDVDRPTMSFVVSSSKSGMAAPVEPVLTEMFLDATHLFYMFICFFL